MHLEYELTQEDLTRVQAQLIEARRQWMRESPLFFVGGMGLVGLLAWPAWSQLTQANPFFDLPGVRTYFYLAAVLIAGGAVWLLRTTIPQPKFAKLNAWSARRMGKVAAQKSVFGPIRIELTEHALVRTNSVDTLSVPWVEVRRVLHSPELVTVQLRKQRRVVLIPARAFPSEEAAQRFVSELERRVMNKPVVLPSVAGG